MYLFKLYRFVGNKGEELKKRKLQEFGQKMGLNVDVPKAGSGTNDGNTARRFLQIRPYPHRSQISIINQMLIFIYYFQHM